MNEGPPEPIPSNQQLTPWDQWRGVVIFFLFVVGSSAAVWHLPGSSQQLRLPIVFLLLGIGLIFDALSVFFRIASVIARRYTSGFPIVGLIFYFWGWLSYPGAFILPVSGGYFLLWLAKFLDLAGLVLFHVLCHISFSFRRSNAPKRNV